MGRVKQHTLSGVVPSQCAQNLLIGCVETGLFSLPLFMRFLSSFTGLLFYLFSFHF